MTALMFPADRFPAPPMRGKPGDPVNRDTVYPGCHVTLGAIHVGTFQQWHTDMPFGTLRMSIGLDCRYNFQGCCIAPNNPQSVIGVGECGVRREDGSVETIWGFKYAAGLVERGDGGLNRWIAVPALTDRYAFVGTLAECEAWVEANKPGLKRWYVDGQGNIARRTDADGAIAPDLEYIVGVLNAHDSSERKDANA